MVEVRFLHYYCYYGGTCLRVLILESFGLNPSLGFGRLLVLWLFVWAAVLITVMVC